jgi:hypothetical protein
MITEAEQIMKDEGRNFLFGNEVFALHASSGFKLRRPMKHGDLNISVGHYTAGEVCQDL